MIEDQGRPHGLLSSRHHTALYNVYRKSKMVLAINLDESSKLRGEEAI
jgi:hypothetical protein